MTPSTALAERHWTLFVDWCTASGHTALPADPGTVAGFLTELPAGPATLARRVRAIDTAHHTAGHPAPGASPQLDTILGRKAPPPSVDPQLVADALSAIVVGGWPAGLTGRRDAAIVALAGSAGLTRTQIQALTLGSRAADSPNARSALPTAGSHDSLAELLGQLSTAPDPGPCPACALTRWWRTADRLHRSGWRTVRAELADHAEVPADAETDHDCRRPLPSLNPHISLAGATLFFAIDRHGVPQAGYPLSTRAITAIIATRLADSIPVDQIDLEPAPTWSLTDRPAQPDGVSDRDWGIRQRRAAEQRYQNVVTTLDQAEREAEAILSRVQAAMGAEIQT